MNDKVTAGLALLAGAAILSILPCLRGPSREQAMAQSSDGSSVYGDEGRTTPDLETGVKPPSRPFTVPNRVVTQPASSEFAPMIQPLPMKQPTISVPAAAKPTGTQVTYQGYIMGPKTQTQTLSGNVENGVRVISLGAQDTSFSPTTILVQKGERVCLEVTTADPKHSITIIGYDVSQKLNAQKQVSVAFTADKLGNFTYVCPHCGMQGTLVVQAAPK